MKLRTRWTVALGDIENRVLFQEIRDLSWDADGLHLRGLAVDEEPLFYGPSYDQYWRFSQDGEELYWESLEKNWKTGWAP